MRYTQYFLYTRQRNDRKDIKLEWIQHVIAHSEREEVQADGRIRRWAKIPEANDKYLDTVEQHLRSPRRNRLPVKRIDGAFLMRHEHTACSLVELTEIGKIPSSADLILDHAPEAFNGIEVMPTMGWEEMEAKFAMVVVEGRVELMGSMNPAAIDGHHDFLRGFLENGHDLVNILAQLLGIEMRHHFREDFGGAILDGANDVEQHAARDPAPRAILQPRVPFAALISFNLTWTQGPCEQAYTLGFAPPARPRQGKTPDARFIFIEHKDLTTAGLIFQGGECKMGKGQSCRSGLESPRGPSVAYVVFF